MTKIAVLTHGTWDDLKGYALYVGDSPKEMVKEIDWVPKKFDAENLFSKMVQYGIDQCWIVPGAARVRLLQPGNFAIMFEKPEDEQGKSFIHDDMKGWKFNKYGDEHLSSCHGYRAGGSQAERKMRSVIWPEYSGWQWEPMNGITMLMALERLQAALGVDLSSSPGVTGRKFMLERLRDQQHAHWFGSVELDLAELPLKSGVADLAWKRDLGKNSREVQISLADLMNGKTGTWYIHQIDKNSMYLSAAAGLPLGIGNPVHVGPEEFIGVAPKLNGAGLYQISVTPPSSVTSDHPWHLLYDGTYGPDPLYGSVEKENRQEYVSSALLKLLYDFDFGVTIHQAWIWPNSKRILEEPAAYLWRQRQALHSEMENETYWESQAAALAYEWIKVVATSMVGLLASKETKDQRFYRPDIWRAVIESAKARMLYNIDKIAEEKGIFPIAVLTDALFYVSQEQRAGEALGKIMERPDQLGGFKLEYTLELDSEVAEALAEPTVSGMARKLGEIAGARKEAARAYHDYDEDIYYPENDGEEDEEDEEVWPIPESPFDPDLSNLKY